MCERLISVWRDCFSGGLWLLSRVHFVVRIARSFTIDAKVLEEARKFLKSHPEFRNMSHLVEYALRKFLEEESKEHG